MARKLAGSFPLLFQSASFVRSDNFLWCHLVAWSYGLGSGRSRRPRFITDYFSGPGRPLGRLCVCQCVRR